MRKIFKRLFGDDQLHELEQERAKRLSLENQLSELQKKYDSVVLELQMLKKESDSAVAELLSRVKQLEQDVAARDAEIARLKAIINKDSSNSSKPPSTDGFKRIANNREKSGKKRGGQSGHKGTTLTIPKNLDDLVAAGTAEHKIINRVAEGEPYVSDWKVDLKIVTVYTEIRRAVGEPPKIEYADGVKTLSVYLSTVGMIPVKRLSEFFNDVSGGLVSIAKATIQKFTHEAADNVDLEPLKTDLLNGTVINVDETPVKTTERENLDGEMETSENESMFVYIRTYSNSRTTLLTPNAHKNTASVENDNILTIFFGVVVQDYEAKFLNYGVATGLCGAHLSRELKGLNELEKIEWAGEVRRLFQEMNAHKNSDLANNINCCDPTVLAGFEAQYDELISNGRAYLDSLNPKSYSAKILAPKVKRLEQRKSEYLLFMRNYEVPFTNNLAERDLRHCKTKQKISGCYRSWAGLVDYCKLRSCIDTARKCGRKIMDTIAALFKQEPALACPAGQ